jgi:hypothetical protein
MHLLRSNLQHDGNSFLYALPTTYMCSGTGPRSPGVCGLAPGPRVLPPHGGPWGGPGRPGPRVPRPRGGPGAAWRPGPGKVRILGPQTRAGGGVPGPVPGPENRDFSGFFGKMPKSAEIREIPENPDFWSISGKTQKKAFFPGILNRFFKTPRIRGGLRSRFGIKKWSIRGFPGPPEIGVFRGSGGRARKSGSRRTPGSGRTPEIRNFGRNPGFPGSGPDPQIWGSWPPPAPGLAPGLGPGPARPRSGAGTCAHGQT